MQPYFLPYLGYWQLLHAVDKFVIYDNIEFSKRGWFHRNQILMNNEAKLFSLPIKKDSDFLDVRERYIADDGLKQLRKIVGQIKSAYSKAPHFKEVIPIIEQLFLYDEKNLFKYILNAIKSIKKEIKIDTEIIVSSEVEIDHSLKGENKVLAICKQLNASSYLNAIGGLELYDRNRFAEEDIPISFIKMDEIIYDQKSSSFVPYLSIIDVLMHNNKEEISKMLDKYSML